MPKPPLDPSAPKPLLARLDPELWKRISVITDEALELPAGEVSAFLDRLCGDDRDLRVLVERLLAADIVATGFLERPVLDLPAPPTPWTGDQSGQPSCTLAPGEELAGRYRITKLLGRGGMGEVYEAWDAELSIPVALKILRLPALGEEETVRRLKRESLLTRSISHPNVCRLYDVGRHGEGEGVRWFLTMEVLRGETLAERLRRQGRFSPDSALPLAQEMAAALGAAHQAGVVHRDFKPSNVMLARGDSGEQAVVTDFGIAGVARAAGAAGNSLTTEEPQDLLAGTPPYMAPEQIRGEPCARAADIYALGIVLYEMLTGELPFAGGSAMEVAKRRLVEDPSPPRSIVPDLDERWEAVILRCLAREPRHRFQRAEEVAAALAGRTLAEEVETLETGGRGWHTLPVERDAFVGRERELEELERNLTSSSRLVTLVGTGGMGKTRLAVRYGWQTLREWPGGVWFCDLTEARDVDGITSAVAESLGVPLGNHPIDQLGHAIAARGRCLVILDNFEQIVEHAEVTISRWMARALEARFLVTSRARLGLHEGERVQAVESLSPEQGLELFTARARWLRPELELVGMEAESAQEVVRLVEGMPLAIELAAARMRVMSATQIVAQMRKRFQLLTGGPSARHETLAAAIDGSWELLQPWEKAAMAQCSVFEGGFTLEAAETVLDLEAWSESPWVVDVLQSLVDKSLLRTWVPETAVGTVLPDVRFGMYVSLQEYARHRLEEKEAVPGGVNGAQAARTVEERHGRWFACYGRDDAIDALDRHGGVERRRALARELENLVVACRRAMAREDDETAAATYWAAWKVLQVHGPFSAAVVLGHEVLGEPLKRDKRALVLYALGEAESLVGQVEEARPHLEAALALHREVSNRRWEGIVLNRLGDLLRLQGRMEEARVHLEVALAIHRDVGNRVFEGNVLANLGNLHFDQGRIEEARAHYEAALAIHREEGNRRSQGIVLSNLGSLHHEQGRMGEARAHYEAALAIHREEGNRRSQGIVLSNLGHLHRELGHWEESRADFQATLAFHREVGDRRWEGMTLGSLGALYLDQRRMKEAQQYLETALGIHREMGHRLEEGVVLSTLGELHLEAGRMQDASHALAQAEALMREGGDRFSLGRLLCLRAALEHQRGDIAAARTVFGEVETLAAKLAAGPDSELGRMLVKLRQALAAT